MQERAGVRAEAEHLAGMLRPELFPAAAALLARVPVLVVAGLDPTGRLWASALVGAPPVVLVDRRHLLLRDCPAAGDPLGGVLRAGNPVGMTAVDFPARRRVRVNGRVLDADVGAEGRGVLVRTEQVYGNCPQHIHPRSWQPAPGGAPAPDPQAGSELTGAQAARLVAADTFFLATVHPGAGVDASHRGGPPGVLIVEHPGRVTWADLAGNNMFNSAGNLAVDPRAALWLPPVAGQGSALLVSGAARVHWHPARDGARTARRFVLDVDAVTEVPMGWRLINPAPSAGRAG